LAVVVNTGSATKQWCSEAGKVTASVTECWQLLPGCH